jgi:hypothetical protein
MTLFTPLPRSDHAACFPLIVIAWVASMAVLVKRSYFDASAANLATDLARYGSNAEWRGVYYRGEKIGFTVSQTVPRDDGSNCRKTAVCRCRCWRIERGSAAHRRACRFELRAALVRFLARSGTGAIVVRGRVDPIDGVGRRARL